MKWFTVAVLSMHAFSSFAQNLVPNAGFEDYIQCPDYPGQIDFSKGWFKTTYASSDYFHKCSANLSVPLNAIGYKKARTGVAYAGIYVFSPDFISFREYISIQLIQPLSIGSKYVVSFM